MHHPRSISLTIVSLLNTLLGVLGGIGAVMFMNDGAGAVNMGEQLQAAGGGDVADAFTTGGGSMMIRGLLSLGAFACIGLGGVGLLMRAGWGRTLTVLGGVLLTAFLLWRATMGEMGGPNWALLAWGIAVPCGLLFTGWRWQFESAGALTEGERQVLRKAA